MVQLANHAKAEVLLITILKLCLALRIYTKVILDCLQGILTRSGSVQPSVNPPSIAAAYSSRAEAPTAETSATYRGKRYPRTWAATCFESRDTLSLLLLGSLHGEMYTNFTNRLQVVHGRHVTVVLINTQEVDAHSSPFVAKIPTLLSRRGSSDCTLHSNGFW